MQVIYYIGLAIAAVLVLLLIVGGVVFWRGWIYAARHRDTIIMERIRLQKLLRENDEIINRINNIKIIEKDGSTD